VSPFNFAIGLDLGQADDWTALTLVVDITDSEAGEKHKTLQVPMLYRWQRPYPDIVRAVKAFMADPRFKGKTAIAVDATGVGRPVVDMLLEEMPLLTRNKDFFGVMIHGGDKQSFDKGYVKVPKRDLVFGAQVALEQGRIKFAKNLELIPTLVEELRNFRLKINPQTAHDSYSHWRENQHDDLVFATALAVWAAGKVRTMSAPAMTRKESYWSQTPGGVTRPPQEAQPGENGWKRMGDPSMGLWEFERSRA
jgi:hypothetical protein